MGTRSDSGGMADGWDRAPEAFAHALLRNPVRLGIRELLEREPGLNKHQLAHRLGVNRTGVDFHVQRLVEARLVEVRTSSHTRELLCFTPENVHLWDQESTRLLFGRAPSRDVAVYLAEHPGAAAEEVAHAVGLSVSTVRRHIRVLEKSDLVQRLRVDRNVIYHAEPALVHWVQEVRTAECELGLPR